MRDKVEIKSKSLLVVEGQDETNFFIALLKKMNIEGVQLLDIGGKDRFRPEMKSLAFAGDLGSVERIGFVRDAEQKPARDAFSSISGILKEIDLPLPAKPKEIQRQSKPLTGIFIMPDNQGTGMLESLCLETIASDPVSACIDDFIECVAAHQREEEDSKTRFNEPKARVQCYLASRVPITNSLGVGAQKGYWDFSHPALNDIKKFLKSLFTEA